MNRKNNKFTNKKLIEIYETPNGRLETQFFLPAGEINTIKVGVALASATRVIAEAFRQELKLNKSHNEQIEAQIAKFYNDDLKIGSLGEEENTKPFTNNHE